MTRIRFLTGLKFPEVNVAAGIKLEATTCLRGHRCSVGWLIGCLFGWLVGWLRSVVFVRFP